MDNDWKGYFAGQAVGGNVVNEMRRKREDFERRSCHQTKEDVLSATVAKFLLNNDKEGAFEYLNNRFMEEVVDDCQHQDDRNFSLETILKKRKSKYKQFYTRIGENMPNNLSSLTADELCEMVGVENIHMEDSGDDDPIIPYESKNDNEGCSGWFGWIVLAAFILGTVIYYSMLY